MKKLAFIFFLAAAVSMPGCTLRTVGSEAPDDAMSAAAVASAKVGLAPAAPQPDEKVLAPGLSVVYLPISVRHIGQLPSGKALERKGRPGSPIPMLDHRFNGEEPIFDSGLSRAVAMVIKGFLRFEQPGAWYFRALSNDGVRVALGGQEVAKDPGVHGDRFTPAVELAVPEAGWYALEVTYFQRKGTAALGLYWQPPGAEGFSAIPAPAFRHSP